ncbi:MAG: formylmethanofuran dehydrogenase subunit A [Nitrososphaerota archaeon]|nr:formylmethanofuran dehydrogenase subunit A [Candidatus Bathyarchaeota archaeon]MDW8024071.1 formylmethanofuran dehydrogenase subunit A [Nitrososphaerota archaeon]
MELLIKNGFVYDPVNGVNGEKMDILVKDGKIVEKIEGRRAKIIDASGMVVMPGGVDIHSHIAGGKVNSGRLLRPEDHFKDFERKTPITRSGVGYSIPSTFTTGYRYARMGWTTVMDPAMPPLEAKHTHEELSDTPIIDKASYPLLGDWWFVLEYLSNAKVEECARHVAWMITATKGYAIKIVNPGGLEAWGYGRNVKSIDDPVPNFGITPREIIRGLCKVNKLLHLPHTIHVHTNNLGVPGNYVTALETMKCVEDLAEDNRPVIHITHCQFCAFKGDDWRTLQSGAEEIANYVNSRSHVTLDMGQVIFTDTTTMTADGPFQYTLYTLSGNKWVNHDVETETSAGVVPFQYRPQSYVNAIQWSIGLELALLIKDPWKIFMTTDHPNGGPFTAYPQVITWLMSKKAREAVLKRINPKARSRSLLPSIDRELDLHEIAILTRAGQARALGLKDKGHLGVGADADIAIYNLNPENLNVEGDYEAITKAFQNAAYTIKGGEIVARNGEVLRHVDGATMWLDVKLCEPCEMEINAELQRRFREYWTVEYENYPVSERYLAVSRPITVKADV